MSGQTARAVADAVLYEGYILYPYRASAQKNRSRWQFGVVMPADFAATDPTETAVSQTECLLEWDEDTTVDVTVRYLQVQRRSIRDAEGVTVGSVLVDGTLVTAWEEAVEREATFRLRLADLAAGEASLHAGAPAGEETEPLRDSAGVTVGTVVRRRERLDAVVTVATTPVPGPWQALKLRVRVENRTPLDPVPGTRDAALPAALIAVHTIVTATGGVFVSMLEPPEWARPAVEECRNIGTWPVLAGEDGAGDVILSSPIILYDHPGIAPESPGDLYDATEVDEILTLRTLALTDEEKREARATDARAAAIIDRVDAMDAATMDRLHGAIRYLRQVTGDDLGVPAAADPGGAPRPGGPDPDRPEAFDTAGKPWWDPGVDAAVNPATDSVVVSGTTLRRGSAVRLSPGARRADAQDMFHVDERPYFAVTLDEDPGAELQRSHGRFLYFTPEEVEPA